MRFAVAILVTLLPAIAYAQSERGLIQRVTDLERRIQRLEAENQALRGMITVMPYLQQAEGGQRVEVKRGDRSLAKLVIGRKGWGEGRPEDVAAVTGSVAKTVFSVIPPADAPTLIILRSEHGPRALANRGPEGECIILLDTGDRLWAQLAYQLAHEFGHVLCRDLNEDAPQHWFEEAFCEALSIWTIEQMAQSWKTAAPYDSWTSYAESLGKYVKDVRSKVDRPSNIGEWYASHRQLLDRESYDRDKNRVIAEQIASRAQTRPEYLQAFLYLRSKPPAANTIESLLQTWLANCPNDLKFVPNEMAKLLGVTVAR